MPLTLLCCSLDLGAFGSAEEAALAHDRAALLAAGFQSRTNHPLPEAVAAVAAGSLLSGGGAAAGRAVHCSLAEAEAFCKWRGGGARVMREAEWQRISDCDTGDRCAC